MTSRGVIKQLPKKLDVNRIPSRPKKRRKITLVFDEEKRRDFLGGFHKRKLQRKKKAQEELQKQLKEERKKIKQDARENYKKLLVSRRDIPELEELLSKEEYETEGHTVSILELNAADLAEKSNWIGENRVMYDNDDKDEDEGSSGESESELISGMELNSEKKAQETKIKPDKKSKDAAKDPKTKKEVKRAVRLQALKRVQNSKVFKLKQRLEHQKNKKQTLHKQKEQERVMKKRKGGTKRKTHRKI